MSGAEFGDIRSQPNPWQDSLPLETFRRKTMTNFPIEHPPLRSLSEVDADREDNEPDVCDDNPAASFKDGDQ